MAQVVVFKSPGKLDLRSITVFGMNSKPMTSTPIGFFGTGLKYAIAVLSREKIPVTFWVDGKKWVIEADPSSFRGKDFTELYICSTTIGGLIKKRIKLPFTTELGKTWKLWQAFRELESNTRDELGQTLLMQQENDNYLVEDLGLKGHTAIIVDSDAFVQVFHDRDRIFLPEGLTQRQGSEDVQVFDRPSDAIYYRGIRILELEKDERSSLTYNILRPMELTEDRTLKSKWDAEYYIAQAVAKQKDPEIIQKAVTSKAETFESKLNYSYGAPSTEFLDVLDTIKLDDLQASASITRKTYRPAPSKPLKDSWLQPIIDLIRAEDYYGSLGSLIEDHRDDMIQILQKAKDSGQYVEYAVGTNEPDVQENADVERERATEDDIPF